MFLVKVLEKKKVIRIFGLALIVTPFVNIILSMSLQLVADKWTWLQFMKVLNAQSLPNNFLNVCSLIIGATMLSGSKRSWKFALALLGAHILLQVPRLGQDLRSSWIYGVFFLVNIGAFLFIADQLAFKQKKTQSTMTKESPAPRVITHSSSKKILVSFYGEKPWAQLVGVSLKSIELKGFESPPAELKKRTLALSLSSELTVTIKFSRQLDNKFFFDYADMNAEQMGQLHSWLRQPAQAA